MDRMGNAKKLVFKIMWEDIRMTGKNKEGYPDPTASKAIQAADHMPEHTYRDESLHQKNVLGCKVGMMIILKKRSS